MSILIIYYSRSGITRDVANIIKDKLNADICEITDNNHYAGPIGWLKGGFNASTGRLSKINPVDKSPLKYDLTIMGSPVWASNIATPLQTYINQNKKNFTKIAGFVTCGSGGGKKALEEISKQTGKKLESKLILTSKDIESNLDEKINIFIEKLKL